MSPYDGSGFVGVDHWLQQDEGDHECGGRGRLYRCLDCAWESRGGSAATAHHRESAHHRILDVALRHTTVFSCCQDLRSAPDVPDATPAPTDHRAQCGRKGS
jgi:hypothetical protein